jgi:hypothetical protein
MQLLQLDAPLIPLEQEVMMRTTILPINHQSLVKIAMSAVQLAPKIPIAAARLIPLVILREQSTEK